MKTEEEEIAELRQALEDAHGIIQEGIAALERINRIITIGEDSTDWVKDAKKLLKKDEAIL